VASANQRSAEAAADTAAHSPAPSPSPAEVTFGDVLANTHYRNILFAQFFSNVGTWMEMFVIQMFLARLTGSLADQGILTAFQQVPIFALGIAGGLLADRVDRRRMLVVTQVLAGIVALGVAWVLWHDFASPRHAVWALWALGGLHGCVMAFNFPAWQVLTPRLVPRVQLTKAITLNGIQFNTARIVGPAVAGFALALIAGPPLLVFNAITFLVMGAVVLTTPPTPAPAPSDVPVARQLTEAVAVAWRHKGIRAVFFAQVLASMLAAPLVRLLSLFAIDVYKLPSVGPHRAAVSGEAVPLSFTGPLTAENAAGLMLAVQGLGAVVGGLSLRYVPSWYPKHHLIPLAIAALGLSICIFSLTTSPWAGFVAMFICGYFWIWTFNQSWAAVQLLAPDAMRGRVLAFVTVAGFGATALGAFGAGWFGELLKARQVLSSAGATQLTVAVLGFPLMVAGIVMMLHRVPEVDNMSPRPDGRPPSRSLWKAITASEHRPREQVEPVDPET
jgi:MFS family permease